MSLKFASRLTALFLFSIVAAAQTAPLWRPKVRPPFPLTRFYDSPKPLPAGKPGDLIRSEPFGDYDLPFVVTVRILYHSQSASGADVAASGVVLTPAGDPPPGGYPVIAWAHPFSGVGRQCAPSLARNLNYGPSFAMWTGLGYAVVATDYAGLGSDARNAALDTRSNANDVLNAVKAAHSAVPHLGARWVALGDSEGAAAVVVLDEMQSQSRDPGYLGSIALSGVADLKEVFARLATGDARSMLTLLAYGVKTAHPEFEAKDMLTPRGIAFYDHLDESCGVPGSSSEALLKPGWENNLFVRQFLDRNRLGGTRAAAPLLVISGEGDSVFPVDLVSSTVTRLCRAGDRVQFDRYPGLNRLQIPGESVTEQTSWIRERFAGKPAPGNCR